VNDGTVDFSPTSGAATVTLPSVTLNGTLSGTDNFVVTGTFGMESGTLAGPSSSSLVAAGGINMFGPDTLDGRSLQIAANSTWDNLTLYTPNPPTITVEPGVILTLLGNNDVSYPGSFPATVDNLAGATIVQEGGGTLFRCTVNNDGLMEVLQGGFLGVGGYTGVETGQFIGDPGTTLEFLGGEKTFAPSSSISGDQVIFALVVGANQTWTIPSYSATGSTTITFYLPGMGGGSGGPPNSIQFTNTVNVGALYVDGVNVDFLGGVTGLSALSVFGTNTTVNIDAAPPGFQTLTPTSVTIGPYTEVTLDGDTLVNSAGQTFDFGAGILNLVNGSKLENYGTVLLGTSLVGGDPTAVFDNYGTLLSSNGGGPDATGTWSSVAVALNNYGTINNAAGQLFIGTFPDNSNSPSFTSAPGSNLIGSSPDAILDLFWPSTFAAGSVIDSLGQVAFSAPSTIAGSYSAGSTYINDAVTFTQAPQIFPSLGLGPYGDLKFLNNFTVNGLFTWYTGGSLTGVGGAATLTAAGGIQFLPYENYSAPDVVDNSTLVNFGTATGTGATFDVTDGGVLDNLPGATFVANAINLSNGGALIGGGTIDANVTNAGQVSPGGTGAASLLTINGSYTQASGGALNIELGGSTPGSQYDQVDLSGAIALDGGLSLSLANGFTPVPGTSFTILKNDGPAAVGGNFAGLPEGTVFQVGLGLWQISYQGNGGNDVVLTYLDTVPSAVTLSPTAGSINEGGILSLSGSFTDPDPGQTHTVVIGWGDGSASSTLNLAAGVLSFSGVTHQYLEESAGQPNGSYPITVTVTDSYGASASGATSIQVNDAPLTSGTASVTAGTEGVSSSILSASFTDANPGSTASDFTATINWGDGQTSTGTVTGSAGSYSISAAHLYAEDGSYPINIAVTDDGGSTTTLSTTATVNDAPLSDKMTATAISAVEGAGTGDQVVGTFADADPNATPSDYTAVIYWGDNTSSAASAITQSGGTFNVHGSHTYAEEGAYHPYAVVTDNEGNPSLTTGRSSVTTSQTLVTVSVADAALSAGAFTPPVATERAAFGPTTVFHFTDADPNGTASDYVATVQTGDATLTSTANPSNVWVVANAAGGFDVQLSYTYAEELSNKTFAVVVSDAGGSSTSQSTTTFSVADAPLAATAVAVTAVTGTSYSGVVASFTDADPAGTATDYRATITWGNGNTSAGTIAANSQGGFNVTGTNTYTADGAFAITVTITDAGGSSVTANSTAYVGGLATHFSVTAATAATAGTSFPLTVKALDAAGNAAYSYTGTVHFVSTDANATLPANYTFTAGDLGTHVFSVTLVTAGTQSVTATDTAKSTIVGKQGGIVVNPGAVSRFTVVSKSGSVTAGSSLQFTVKALDAFGNTVTGYRGTVNLTSSDPQAVLPANYTFTTSDAGVHVFSVTLKTAGSQTVVVTDTATSPVTGTSGPVTVNPAAASHFRISAPASVSKGVKFSFTVTALDAFGNVATGYLGTVSFTSSDAKAVPPANYTFTTTNAGVATFSAILNTVGVQSLTATDTKQKTIKGTDASIQVS
jgi:hypothetical protein